VKLVEFLRPEFVLPDLAATDRDGVFAEVCAFLVAHDPSLPPADRLLEVISLRERQQSTGIGDETAVPHGRFPGLARMVVAYARSKQGVEFQGTDGRVAPFRHFLVVLSPVEQSGLYLKILRRIMRVIPSNPGLRERLLAAGDAKQLFDLIAEDDARL